MKAPSHATAVAYAALFFALAGSATAAGVATNSIGSKQIKNGSVTVADLATPAKPIGKAKLASVVEDVITDPTLGITIRVQGEKGDKGDAVPGTPGPEGAPGADGVPVITTVTQTVTLAPNEGRKVTSECPVGTKVTGGGGVFGYSAQPGATQIMSSGPEGQKWIVDAFNPPGDSRPITVTAICTVTR